MLKRPAARLDRCVTKLVFLFLWIFCTLVFYFTLFLLYQQKQYSNLVLVCGPILAVLYGFSALAYNRARAVKNKKVVMRALYIAELGWNATSLYMFGVVVGGVGAGLGYLDEKFQNQFFHLTFLGMTAFSTLLIMFAFAQFFRAFEASIRGNFRRQTHQRMLRRVGKF